MKKMLYALVVLCTTSAFGWTCNVPGQIRVQVPTGTVGNGVGDGSGQVVVDNGLTFECETLPTASGTAVTGLLLLLLLLLVVAVCVCQSNTSTIVPRQHKSIVPRQHKSQRCPVTPLQNECPVVRGEK